MIVSLRYYNKNKNIMTNALTFTQVLESEYYYFVEAIEHGSSDPEVIENYKTELKNKTGYTYL